MRLVRIYYHITYLNSIYNFAVHFSIVFHPHIGQQAATMIVQLENIKSHFFLLKIYIIHF